MWSKSRPRRTVHWILCDATFQAVPDQSRSRCIRLSSGIYAATAWDPYHLNNINSLEMVQRRSARFVTGNYNRTPGTVTRILSDLQWPTLQRRRQDARLYLLYRSIQGNIAVSLPSYITKQTRTTRHTHPQRFLQVRASTQTYQNSFFPRTVRDWNDLPPDILEAPTAALLKTAVTSRVAWMRREALDFILHQRTFYSCIYLVLSMTAPFPSPACAMETLPCKDTYI